MEASFHLGRVRGVRIGVHWSVLAIFVLVAGTLAVGVFPASHPQYGPVAHVAAAVVTALAFFASLLAHEISHALVARRNGLGADSITLWLLGGVARLSGEARTPGADLRIAGVGPLVSLLLGVAFSGLGAGLALAGGGGLVSAGFVWLGGINLVLAVFNVIPAAPLDGGRLLRSLIWWRTGDRLKAAVWSSRAGQVFGWLLAGLGVLQFLVGAGFGGLWLVLVGWFLVGAATAEGRQATARARLGGLTLSDLMTSDPVTAPASMTVEELLRSDLPRQRHSTFPLTEDGGPPVGLVTFDQVRKVTPQAQSSTRLRDIGCPMEQVAQGRPDEPVADVLPRASQCAQGRTLVMTDGELVGIVSPSDINRMVRWTGVPDQTPRAV